jgi:hypothetical protein
MNWRAALRTALADIDEPVMEPPMNRLTAMPPAPTRAPRTAAVSTVPRGLENDDLAGRLERATSRALERADDLLEIDISDEGHEKFGDKLRSLNSTIKTVIGTQVRVDEHRLKARKLDVLPQLLEAIEAEEKRRALA